MSTNDKDIRLQDGEHPSDELPDFLRGALSPERQREVAAHVEDCPVCAAELDVLSLLADQPAPAMTEAERNRVYDRVGFGRVASTGTSRRSEWRSAAWKVAAAIALLITGVGVWQIYLTGSPEAGWSAAAVLEAWDEDVREFAPSSEDAEALLAFIESAPPVSGVDYGRGDLDQVVEGVLDGLDPGVLDGIAVPWEE